MFQYPFKFVGRGVFVQYDKFCVDHMYYYRIRLYLCEINVVLLKEFRNNLLLLFILCRWFV